MMSRTKNRQPVLFMGHGNPMNAINDNPFRPQWEKMGQDIAAHRERPRAILCISAHWITRGWQITTAEQPRTIHDFGGFPPELFAQQYPAPGSPAIAQEIMHQLRDAASITSDEGQWGLDHGAWSVLQSLYPQADIPVLQLSINAHANFEQHYRLGQALSPLRDQGIIIVASGNTVHNFDYMHIPAHDRRWNYAFEFDAMIAQSIEQNQHERLYHFKNEHSLQLLRHAHPNPDHYIPLLYAAGAACADEQVQFFLDEKYPQAPVGMRSIQWG